MASGEQLKHISIDRFVSTKDYISPNVGNGNKLIFPRDRAIHGGKLLNDLAQVIADKQRLDTNVQTGLVQDDAIYVEFVSAFDYQLAFDEFDSKSEKKITYKLLSTKKELTIVNGEKKTNFRITLLLTKGGLSKLIDQLNLYTTLTRFAKFNNVEEIKMATLRSFWTESHVTPFPESEEVVWWEVWFRKSENQLVDIQKINNQLQLVGAQLGERHIDFPEHLIKLVKASPNQLTESLLFLDNLAELRKPREVAEFFTNLSNKDQSDWMNDLISRVENKTDIDSVAICILDSGIQNNHPLLNAFIPVDNMYSIKADWGNTDNYPNGGHGTGMAGLALYGDLTNKLVTSENILIYHQIESVKVLNHRDPNNPNLYGSITEEACATPIVDFPNRQRVYCLAVTAPTTIGNQEDEYFGRPSSWSAAVDKIAFGENENKQLIIVSGGNVQPQQQSDYKDLNETSSIEDPAQSFNAITVGAYTELDQIDLNKYQNFNVLAEKGDLSPSSTTSLLWDSKWPIKPEIVLEGGNYAYNSMYASKLDSLQMLSLHSDFTNTPFQTFGDTSGATALAAKLAAEIMVEHPTIWAETVRALLIHSADWTEKMLNKPLAQMNLYEKRNLLRMFGFGVPSLNKALYSMKNALTLIAENKIQPFKKDKTVTYNTYHLYELPWPKDVLLNEVHDNDAIVTITLSYFIEPNPGNRLYSNSYSYQSHGLGYRMIGKDEDTETFLKRISKDTREDGEKGFSSEPWLLGPKVREKGSIQKDKLILSGADLASRNMIAVFPKTGWYKTREKQGKFNSELRYSLVISIETPSNDVDIYQPVLQQIEVPVLI